MFETLAEIFLSWVFFGGLAVLLYACTIFLMVTGTLLSIMAKISKRMAYRWGIEQWSFSVFFNSIVLSPAYSVAAISWRYFVDVEQHLAPKQYQWRTSVNVIVSAILWPALILGLFFCKELIIATICAMWIALFVYKYYVDYTNPLVRLQPKR